MILPNIIEFFYSYFLKEFFCYFLNTFFTFS